MDLEEVEQVLERERIPRRDIWGARYVNFAINEFGYNEGDELIEILERQRTTAFIVRRIVDDLKCTFGEYFAACGLADALLWRYSNSDKHASKEVLAKLSAGVRKVRAYRALGMTLLPIRRRGLKRIRWRISKRFRHAK